MAEILREVFLIMDPSHPRYYYQPDDILKRLQTCGFTTEAPELEKFLLRDISPAMADVIKRLGVENQLSLQQVDAEKYSIELSWIRVIARS